MSHHAASRWLVSYDHRGAAQPGARVQAAQENGVPVQYSVFFVHASAAQIGSLMVQLAKLINVKQMTFAPTGCQKMHGKLRWAAQSFQKIYG